MREDSQIALNQCVWKCRAFFPDAALVYSRIYIAVRYSRLGVNPDQKEGFDPCRERGEQCETTPRSVELLRFWRRRPCSSGPPPYCPVPPRNHLPHFQLGEIQIQLNYTIYLATIIIIDCWKSSSPLGVPSSALDCYYDFLCISNFSAII